MPTKMSQFINGGNIQAGDRLVGLRNNLNTIFTGNIPSGSGFTLTVNQVAHGLVLGNIVRLNGGNFIRAQADSTVNAEVVGIVASVIDADSFVLQFGGLVTNLNTAGYAPLVPGTVYFLDAAVAGNLVVVPPAVVGQVRKAILVAYTASSAFWQNYLGQVI
jgi:hypothetical protein